jgi:hypothetical protein
MESWDASDALRIRGLLILLAGLGVVLVGRFALFPSGRFNAGFLSLIVGLVLLSLSVALLGRLAPRFTE